jgi:hypothetical protein
MGAGAGGLRLLSGRGNMRTKKALAMVSLGVVLLLAAALAVQGCGKKGGTATDDQTQGRPESVTAYEAVGFTKPAASKWESENWMIQVRDSDADGIGRNGKAKIWEVYFFSPTPEEDSQLFVIYNRGNVWPNVPTKNKGGDQGRDVYKKGRPPDFRVDSPEAYAVAIRNGGTDFMATHPDAKAHVVLRCKADYDAVGEKMPAPKYKWIWDVYFREPKIGADVLHVYVDGMNGDYISKELKNSPS